MAEGRTEDAKTAICALLNAGKADAVVQKIAAALIRPPRRKRGRQKTLAKHWFEIGEEFYAMRSVGVLHDDALLKLSETFGYAETTVRKAIKEYDAAKTASDEASRS